MSFTYEEQKMEDWLDEVAELNDSEWSDEDILNQVKKWYRYGDDVTLTWETKRSVHSRAVVLGFPSEPKEGEVCYVKLNQTWDHAKVEGVEGKRWLFAGSRSAWGSRGYNSKRWIDISVPPK